jgi:hypothetical protein
VRIFFEEVIRENLDIGRPKHVQLIFERWVTKKTPGPFRTRVITDGVIPSLHIDYKGTRIKQYHKEGRALRTETTINNTRDFYIGKSLRNLPALRQIGFQANRRLLEVQQISHDCILAEEAFQKVNRPVQVESQRASALRFADPQVQALWSAMLLFQLLPTGFSNPNLRQHLAPLLGQQPADLTPRTDDLSSPSSTFARNDRTHPEESSLPRDRSSTPHRLVLHSFLQSPPPTRPWTNPAGVFSSQQCATSLLSQTRSGGEVLG